MKRVLSILLFAILMAPAQGVAAKWQLDPAHSNFFFEVRHTYAAIRGQFVEFSGDVVFDPTSLQGSKFDFTIRVDSIDTLIGKRDSHLRSPDFFDAKKYPQITFRSSKVTHAGDNKYVVDGTLTMKDATQKIALTFDYLGQKDNPLKPGQTVAGLDARFSLDRLAYRVGDGKFYKLGVVGKDIDIMVSLELVRDT